MNHQAFVGTAAPPAVPTLVPEIRLHLAADVVTLWEEMELSSGEKNLPPPFWAACWPGGQALARYILDNPDVVRGKRILDFASGGGVQAIAAMRAGAASVLASDIDPYALTALAMNAQLNGVTFEITDADLCDRDDGWDIVFAGDICYERPAAARFTTWLRKLAKRGALVLMGDPGRTYMPGDGLAAVATYTVPTSRSLEDREQRQTTVWRFLT